jgi:hypothetical protein
VQNSGFIKISRTLVAVSCFLVDTISFERGIDCLVIESQLFGCCKENNFFTSMSSRLNDMKKSDVKKILLLTAITVNVCFTLFNLRFQIPEICGIRLKNARRFAALRLPIASAVHHNGHRFICTSADIKTKLM